MELDNAKVLPTLQYCKLCYHEWIYHSLYSPQKCSKCECEIPEHEHKWMFKEWGKHFSGTKLRRVECIICKETAFDENFSYRKRGA